MSMGDSAVASRKTAILVSTLLLLMGWYRSPESNGAIELASKQRKSSAALTGSKKISSADFNAALPKPVSKVKPSKKAVQPKKVAITFDDRKEVRPSTTRFFNKMRVAESGHGDLPIDPPVPTPTPEPKAPAPVRKRQVVQESYDVDPIAYESEQSYRMAARVTARPYSRARTSSVTLIPTGGLSYSQFDVTGPVAVANSVSTVDFNARPGFMAGLLVETGRNTFSFQTGIVYIQEGLAIRMSGLSSSGVQFSGDATMKAHFVGLPLLAKINTGAAGETRVSVKGGIVPVYATNIDTQSNERLTQGSYTQNYSSEYSSQTNLRQWNVLGQVGAGIVLPSGGNVDFRFDVLYNRSLMPLQSASDTSMYSQSFMGVLGMGIPL